MFETMASALCRAQDQGQAEPSAAEPMEVDTPAPAPASAPITASGATPKVLMMWIL